MNSCAMTCMKLYWTKAFSQPQNTHSNDGTNAKGMNSGR